MKISTIHTQALDELFKHSIQGWRSNSSSQLLHFAMKYEVTNAHLWSMEGDKAKEKEKRHRWQKNHLREQKTAKVHSEFREKEQQGAKEIIREEKKTRVSDVKNPQPDERE